MAKIQGQHVKLQLSLLCTCNEQVVFETYKKKKKDSIVGKMKLRNKSNKIHVRTIEGKVQNTDEKNQKILC